MKNMMLFLMALLMSGHMMAQQTIVTGVITDANDGSPLIGANVLVKGAGTGSIANVDGKYSVNVPNGKNVLVFSCVGYKEQEITLKPGQKVLNVTMKEDTELLDEVVVIGYGSMKKSDLTGSVTSIKSEDLMKVFRFVVLIHSPPLPNRFISWMVFLLPVVECREQAKTV